MEEKEKFKNELHTRLVQAIESLQKQDPKKWVKQRQLADALDILPQGVSNILRGERMITIFQLASLEEKTGISSRWILTGNGNQFVDNETNQCSSKNDVNKESSSQIKPISRTELNSNTSLINDLKLQIDDLKEKIKTLEEDNRTLVEIVKNLSELLKDSAELKAITSLT